MAGCTLIFIRLLRPDYCFVSTLLEDEINTHHHGGFIFPSLFPSSEAPHLLSIVSQSYIITPQHLFLPTLVPLLRVDKALYPSAFKVMVFLPTARQVGFAAEVLSKVPDLEPIYEIHSRLSQIQAD